MSIPDLRVSLAIAAIEYYLSTGNMMSVPQGLPDELLSSSAGAFVCLKTQGSLRGCMGTIEPNRSCVAEEIIHNAVSAAVHDPRFLPLEEVELSGIECTVDVLTTPEVCKGDQLDPKRYGVIVECGARRGLLLPDLDGVDTVDEQVDIARRKGGISSHEPYVLYRFEVKRYGG